MNSDMDPEFLQLGRKALTLEEYRKRDKKSSAKQNSTCTSLEFYSEELGSSARKPVNVRNNSKSMAHKRKSHKSFCFFPTEPMKSCLKMKGKTELESPYKKNVLGNSVEIERCSYRSPQPLTGYNTKVPGNYHGLPSENIVVESTMTEAHDLLAQNEIDERSVKTIDNYNKWAPLVDHEHRDNQPEYETDETESVASSDAYSLDTDSLCSGETEIHSNSDSEEPVKAKRPKIIGYFKQKFAINKVKFPKFKGKAIKCTDYTPMLTGAAMDKQQVDSKSILERAANKIMVLSRWHQAYPEERLFTEKAVADINFDFSKAAESCWSEKYNNFCHARLGDESPKLQDQQKNRKKDKCKPMQSHELNSALDNLWKRITGVCSAMKSAVEKDTLASLEPLSVPYKPLQEVPLQEEKEEPAKHSHSEHAKSGAPISGGKFETVSNHSTKSPLKRKWNMVDRRTSDPPLPKPVPTPDMAMPPASQACGVKKLESGSFHWEYY